MRGLGKSYLIIRIILIFDMIGLVLNEKFFFHGSGHPLTDLVALFRDHMLSHLLLFQNCTILGCVSFSCFSFSIYKAVYVS